MLDEYLKILESFKDHQISKIIETINFKVLNALKSHNFNPRIAPYLKKINKKGIPFTDFNEDPDNISQIKKLINALYHARLAFLDLEHIDIRRFDRRVHDLRHLYSNTIHEAYKASYLLTHLEVDLTGIFHEEYVLLGQLQNKFAALASYIPIDKNQLTKTLKTYPVSYTSGLVSGIALNQIKPSDGERDFNFLAEFGAALPGYIDQFTNYINKYSSGLIKNESPLNQEKLLELQNAAYRLLQNIDTLKSKNFIAPLKLLNYIGIVRHTITLSMSTIEQIGNLSESSQDVIREKIAQLKYSVLPTLFGIVDKIEDNAMLKPGTLSKPLMEKVNALYKTLIFYASAPVNFEAKGEELLSIEDSRFVSLRLELTYKRIDEANKALFKIQKVQMAFNQFYELLEDENFKEYNLNQLPSETKQELISCYKIIKPYMEQIDIDLSTTIINALTHPTPWSSYLIRPYKWATGKKDTRIFDIKPALHALINKNRASQQFHIHLNEDLISSVYRQSNLTLFPYNGDNLFSVNELDAIDPKYGNASELKTTINEDQWVILSPEDNNLDKLNSNQSLNLYQWYKKKLNKFRDASNAYGQLINMLRDITNSNSPSAIYFEDLDEEVKLECRNLYNRFQPYFISGIPFKDRVTAQAIDKHLCHFFSGKPTVAKAFDINVFEAFDEDFQQYFTQVGLKWNTQSRFYLNLASEKHAAEAAITPLGQEQDKATRAHHLIKHTRYSEFFIVLKKNIYEMTIYLNNSMNAQLQPAKPFTPFAEPEATNQTTGWTLLGYSIPSPKKYYHAATETANGYFNKEVLPYPELKDSNKTLSQPTQVLAIKRLFNSIYHIEQTLHELEQLNDKHTESRYVYHLLQGYGHIDEIIKLSDSLASDPHFKLLGQELIHKFQTLIATFEEHTDAYQMPSDKVPYGIAAQNNSLWFIINAFYISPKHIRTLRNSNFTTTTELDKLHLNAKKSTLRIEKIINDSNSYFKLFLQIPEMYKLYGDLTNKLNEFTSTSHDAVINNLNQIKTTVFTPMLLEADKWEDNLGLKPGLISGPLKDITDEYFKGLLHPLDLSSKTHIDLISDTESLSKRQQKGLRKIEFANKQQSRIKSRYDQINQLKNLIEEYQIYKATLESVKDDAPMVEAQKKQLIEHYRKILPKLVRLHPKIAVVENTSPHSLQLDEFLNSNINKYDKKFSNIEALVIGCLNYYKGIIASYEMKANSAIEKVRYLLELSEKHPQNIIDFKENYSESAFDKQVDSYCNRYYGLLYVHIEYRDKLNAHLLTFKQEIINASKNSADINASIKSRLEAEIEKFETTHLPKYHHLDTIRNAIAQFNTYFSVANIAIKENNSSYESKKTLAEKTKIINQLDSFAADKNLTIEQRIAFMKKQVEPVRFKGVLLNHKKPDILTYAFLKQIVSSLLEALHLHTPERKKLYKNISHAIKKEPQKNRFGLFAKSAIPQTTPVQNPEPTQPASNHPN